MSDDLVKRMNAARDFPNNTCPASRHAAMIAEALSQKQTYHMLEEEPEHCGGRIAATVAALWECRAALAELKGDRQMSDVPTCSFCGREVRDDDRIEELEAKNARLREALEILEIAATGAGVPHDVERKNLHEGIKIARAALKETDK